MKDEEVKVPPGCKLVGEGVFQIEDPAAFEAYLAPTIKANLAAVEDAPAERSGEGWHGHLTCSACPVQIEGEVDGHAFYFRARGSGWSFGVSKDKVREVGQETAHDQAVGGPYALQIGGRCKGDGFSGSWMRHSVAWRLVERGIRRLRRGATKAKPKTWREVKEFLDTLTEEQLDREALWTGEDKGGSVYGFWVLDEPWTWAGGEGLERSADVKKYLVDDCEYTEEEATREVEGSQWPVGQLLLQVDPE